MQSKTLFRQPIATLTRVLQLFVMDTVCTVLPEKLYSHRHPLLSIAVHGAGTVRATCVRCTGGNQHVVAVAYKRTAAVRDVQLKVAVATALARVPVDLVPG